MDNFKSLVDFELELAAFSRLIGLNSAGKTTMLEAMAFLAQLMHGHLTEWLRQRDWKATGKRLICSANWSKNAPFLITPHQLRDQITDKVIRDLLGPAGGPLAAWPWRGAGYTVPDITPLI